MIYDICVYVCTCVCARTTHKYSFPSDAIILCPRERDVSPWYSLRSVCDGSSDQSSMVDPLSYTTGVTKAVVCAILSVG